MNANQDTRQAFWAIISLDNDDRSTIPLMLSYLYTLAYDDEGDAASAEHYMVNGTRTLKAATTPSTPLSEEELSRHAKMMNNVVVCAIAQKYDISELKELATSKFHELLWLKAPSHGLPGVINAVFETTSITDSGLRSVATEYCTHYSTEIVADDHLSSMFKDRSELGLDVLRQYKAEKQKEVSALKGEMAAMVTNIIYVQAARGNEETMSAHKQKLKTALDSISNMK